ncbi:MAG TPA: CocE/NonD family hydrolase [Acidimicrobiia bacterium]|nr:CocE/NonD family hydrolase [Acidimicrobiia bacterium]
MAASEHRDGMRIDWDVAIVMDDGLRLSADVFRPEDDHPHPVLISYGPYAKGLSFQEGYPDQWKRMIDAYPEVAEGTTNQYQAWEVVDPEKWVPEGYVCIRVDSRGAGRSPGFIDHFSPRETADLYHCIEWAGTQPWSSGKVGLSGISYYAINQWQAAALRPPHLAAICPWEGAADFYRDMTYHGGILSTFFANWYDMQVKTVQYGLGDRGPRHPLTGVNACGDETLDGDVLASNRSDLGGDIAAHPLDDEHHRDRSARLEDIDVPILSAANWGGHGLHARGNFEGFLRAGSPQKWLEVHGEEHWTHFYTDYGRRLQLEFFDHFLKGADNGWAERPPVLLRVRHTDHFEDRAEDGWPIPRTEWTTFHFQADRSLGTAAADGGIDLAFDAAGDGLVFTTVPFESETEITGPSRLDLTISSSTTDADVFVVIGVVDPAGEEVVFQGALDPHSPVAQGWLRASHRALDQERSLPWRPWHPHQSTDPLTPGTQYELAIEIWPTSIVIPAGHRLTLTVRGKDYEYGGTDTGGVDISTFKNRFTGCGPFIHPEVFGGTTTVHTGALTLPVIPAKPD